MKQFKRILCISDMHHPFAHKDTVPFLKALEKKYKFDKVVCMGDEVDFHSISFHDHDPDLLSPGDELLAAIEGLKPIYKLFPKVDVLESNHGSLVFRKGKASGLPRSVFRSYNEILEAPKGWTWHFNLRINTPLGPVFFTHGTSGTAGKLASQYGQSCVQAHFHSKAQIHYISTPERLLFDAHTGCLIDDKKLAFAYNKTTAQRPIISVLVIINGIPHVEPMVLDRRGRWVGKV